MKKIGILFFSLYCLVQFSFAQTDSVNSVDIDEIEVTVKSVKLSPKGDSLTVDLLLHSYLKDPRELKINTFATGLISPQGKVLFYDTMTIGRVKISLADRKNYLHYLLKRNEPVLFTIKTPSWSKAWGLPKNVRLTLEDHQDEGKFLQVDIPL